MSSISTGNFKRCSKIWGIETTEKFREDRDKTHACLHKIFKHIETEVKLGNITNIKRLGYITMKDGTERTAAQYKNEHSYLFGNNSSDESLKRTLLMYALERFAGYFSRNGKDKFPTITNHEKGLYFKDRFVSMDEKGRTITIPTIYGTHKLKYNSSIKTNLINKNKVGKFGGNYTFRNNTFIVAVQVPFVTQYDVDSSKIIAFDLNRTAADWIAFNDGTIISRSTEVDEVCEQIREINKFLDPDKKKPLVAEDEKKRRQLRTKARRPIRLEWKKAHKKLKTLIREVCEQIVKKAQDSQSILSIDSVKTGQKNGTFGQDHLIPLLQTMCENKGVPFYVIPCKNTSRRCSKCGFIHKDNRLDTDTFKCIECGHTDSAHLNASHNIAHQAKRLFDAGYPCGNYARRSVDKLVEEAENNS